VGRTGAALHRLANEHVDAVIVEDPWCGLVGMALAQAVRQRWPGACVVILSEAASNMMPAAADMSCRLLPKSTTTRQLKQCLAQLLPAGAASLADEYAGWYSRQHVAPAQAPRSSRVN